METHRAQYIAKALRKKLQQGEFPANSKMPSIRELAKAFDVSTKTIQQSLKQLEKEGWIETRSRSGTYVCGSGEAPQAETVKNLSSGKRKADWVADQIGEAISAGNFRVGEYLPSRKTLRFRFNTSPVTLQSALFNAEKRGFIHRKGNSFIVGPANLGHGRTYKHVYILSAVSPAGVNVARQRFPSSFLQPFESELANLGVSFSGQFGGDISRSGRSASIAKRNALGFLYPGYVISWVEESANEVHGQVERELEWLSGLGVPVTMFNSTTLIGYKKGFSFRPYKNLFPLGVDNRAAGKCAGVFLGLLGHQKVAFFSFSDDFWNPPRGEGLARGLRDVLGSQAQVKAWNAQSNKPGLVADALRRGGKLDRQIEKMVSSISRGKSFESPLTSEGIKSGFARSIVLEEQNKITKRFFDQALMDRSITAWVCADPSIAIGARRYLIQKGIRIPERIGILSIDDNEDVSDLGITACNFQIDRMAYLAAHCLLGDIPIKRTAIGLVECPPRIFDRGSVLRTKG